ILILARSGWRRLPIPVVASSHRTLVPTLNFKSSKPMTVAFGGVMQASSVEVLVETKFSALDSTVPHDGYPSMMVYNLRLDGNHTQKLWAALVRYFWKSQLLRRPRKF